MSNSKKVMVIIILLATIMSINYAQAMKLGVNYYHESMMTSQWKTQYYPVSLTQAGLDLDAIKTIANNVKFYANPFITENLQWVTQLNNLALSKGIETAINLIVDDRQLDNSNWWDYRQRVIDTCKLFQGKTSTVLVGNEISLHTTMDKYEIKNKVVELMNECKKVFTGEVSYQEFWYSKEAWYGYSGKIYFTQYEDTNKFKTNVEEMNNRWGSNAVVGEFGSRLIDDSTGKNMGEEWQADQVKQRLDIIKNTATTIAYIFAYREPSADGFGIIRADGNKRPVWQVLTNTQTTSTTTAPVQTSTITATIPSTISNLVPTCTISGGSCTIKTDTTSGTCRSITFGSNNGDIGIMSCDKGANYEIYRQTYPQGTKFKACLNGVCIDEMGGWAQISKTSTIPTTQTTQTTAPTPVTTTTSPITANTVSTSGAYSCAINGQSCSLTSDNTSGTCRTVKFNTNAGDIQIMSCDKGGYKEVYRQAYPSGNKFKACLYGACVDEISGFAKI